MSIHHWGWVLENQFEKQVKRIAKREWDHFYIYYSRELDERTGEGRAEGHMYETERKRDKKKKHDCIQKGRKTKSEMEKITQKCYVEKSLAKSMTWADFSLRYQFKAVFDEWNDDFMLVKVAFVAYLAWSLPFSKWQIFNNTT